jgi:hypothetical protein
VVGGLSLDIIKGTPWTRAFDPIKTKSTPAFVARARDDVCKAQSLAFVLGDASPALLLHGASDGTVYTWSFRAAGAGDPGQEPARDLQAGG